MKIAVIGAGSVGGCLGARLIGAGHDLSFIARGATLTALQTRGLRLSGAGGDLHLKAVRAFRDPARVGPCDVIVVAVAVFDASVAAALIGPLLGPDTLVLTLQDGIEAPGRLGGKLGARRMLGGGAYVAVHAAAPAVLHQVDGAVRVEMAPLDAMISPLACEFADALRHAGFAVSLTSDVMAVLWRRFCLQAVLSAVTAHFGEPVGAVRTEAASRALMIAMISESVAVARARGVVLETGVEAMILQWLDRMPEGAGLAVDQAPGVDFPDLLIRYGEESGLEMPVVRGLAMRSRDGARRGVA